LPQRFCKFCAKIFVWPHSIGWLRLVGSLKPINRKIEKSLKFLKIGRQNRQTEENRGYALLIPAPNLDEGIPLPIFQFWCWDFIPLPNFLKMHLVRGFYPKLVRGERYGNLPFSSTNLQWSKKIFTFEAIPH